MRILLVNCKEYLSTNNIGKILLKRGIYASVVDHITPDFVATIPIPWLKPEKEREIADKVRAAEKKDKTFLAERNEIEKIMFKNINNINLKDWFFLPKRIVPS